MREQQDPGRNRSKYFTRIIKIKKSKYTFFKSVPNFIDSDGLNNCL